eukprot:TRINITY_DN68961_c0_g1_i1.p1 TRINITY_DN68961_c0_g1~~TRINITY_DN68961_c0_g1_i1.p1  ORF type:complete len:510 (-),score=69.25 TRINITY_DN68961_c0_g1_i1:100-1629(-)
MVVLAAAILTKSGKPLVSRQFVDMSRIRIEGLLSAFPKLMGSGKQYTYFETESVRYVYQPLESLFLVLVTNRSSNIVEDLETLRLMGRMIPEYSALDEDDISLHAFEVLFAFDEVIQMGYRENLTLEQINTFLDMESHEERLAQAITQSKVADATSQAAVKARQLSKDKKKAMPSGGYAAISSEDFGPSLTDTGTSDDFTVVDTPIQTQPTVEKTTPKPKRVGGGGGMSLGKGKNKTDLLAKMKKSGEIEDSPTRVEQAPAKAAPRAMPEVTMEAIHVKIDEKINAVLNRDGGFQSVEVKGDMLLTVSDSSCANIKVKLNPDKSNDYAWKTHPNINKVLFGKERLLALKDPSKPFPTGNTLGILRWRLQNAANFVAPISVNCWPTGNSVSIEYEMERDDYTLTDVMISIPVPSAPAVKDYESGSYQYDASSGCLLWSLEELGGDNTSGSLEFEVENEESPDAYFPISVEFVAPTPLCGVKLESILSTEDGSSPEYSSEVCTSVESYTIV